MVPLLIGVSASIERIRELIKHVADTGLNIVISGESGVGKEVVAQNLYQLSPRRHKPFIKVNCAALPDGLLESELFGFERGAFTGAERKKRGKFELAHEGVLFLDEIGDMSFSLQAKLLHVLQSGEFAPLGSEREFKTDTWVIAATNCELEKSIREGKFREDLYYRLNIIKIQIPPLRERPEDIPPLVDYYIDRYISQFDNKQLLKPGIHIVQRLMEYPWPGNVRELQNVLKRFLVVCDWDEIVDELSINKPYSDPQSGNASLPGAPSAGLSAASIVSDYLNLNGSEQSDFKGFSLKDIKRQALDHVEKEVIAFVLDKTGWNRSKASKILKVSYKTLLYKIADLNIAPPMA
ncbi:MAG: sigma-54 dependent transcriptional regulator [Desulfobacterales bacterium]|jgi:transcriptional regulator with PAS, ATPase and Fis domain|nr:sigma-54 dependent transcriptional regulator [Desulfobacterales bacterium]